MSGSILPPHGGGKLVNRTVPESERESLINETKGMKTYNISDSDLSVFYRMADGALSPLIGPMEEEEFNKVLEEEVIEREGKKYAWTIPLAFPIDAQEAEKLSVGETVAVKNSSKELIGVLKITDIYKFDKEKYNSAVYGTEREDHPGARIFNNDQRDYLLGGEIWALPQADNGILSRYMLTPAESRALFKRRGWEKILAFQTRNALHRAHEYALLYATEQLVDQGYFTGAVLNPLVGATKSDDIPADVRMKTYVELLKKKQLGQGDRNEELWSSVDFDFYENLILAGLDMKMFYAGPKEAVMHAIYRQNYGFSNIVIGRKHADAPFDDGEAIWGDFDAHHKFEKLNGELLISPSKVGFAAFFEEINRVGLIKEFVPKGYHSVSISGSALREKFNNGEPVDERIMRKCVADILTDHYQEEKEKEREKSSNVVWHDTVVTKEQREARKGHKGVVLWFTGLSGCGKSTVATEVEKKLFDMGKDVFILDGDNVRHGLNGDLGFSPEDRDENIRRIGEVAHLFAESGMITIASFISPYKEGRERARKLNEEGDFIEVYIKAPVEVCEERDPKGLYEMARKGEIDNFTGISAPYEEPENPELVVDTSRLNVEESAQKVIDYLEEKEII
jgi:sulfate adenylyltransferase